MSVTDINNLCLFLNLYCAFLFKEFKKRWLNKKEEDITCWYTCMYVHMNIWSTSSIQLCNLIIEFLALEFDTLSIHFTYRPLLYLILRYFNALIEISKKYSWHFSFLTLIQYAIQSKKSKQQKGGRGKDDSLGCVYIFGSLPCKLILCLQMAL